MSLTLIMRNHAARALLIVGLALASGCRGNDAAQGAGAPAAPPPTPVKLLALEEKSIEQTSEFIATIRSLRSTRVQPEVEGLVTRIFVKSGDRVREGAPLVQINADKQQATVRSTEANRAGTEADVQYLAVAGQAPGAHSWTRAPSANRSSSRRRTRCARQRRGSARSTPRYVKGRSNCSTTAS